MLYVGTGPSYQSLKDVRELKKQNKWEKTYYKTAESVKAHLLPILHPCALICPQHISDLFTSKNTRFNLRNADISIPRFNTVNYGRHSLRYLGGRIWSKLDAGVKSSATLEIFKAKIRKVSIDYLMTENCTSMLEYGVS